ncbi:MAG: Serine hydroxymethyltransferase [Planctomycetes bacterium ADurb.Bin126]|nr:MAG: Serine hydroxymethyltransferase [Planctomycetes bacterium ADurb.Bin126]HOD82704.1 serine hydroxymethyltransferase [Phycisphaerae bacterium]HQL72589.1 serine hydroxymethyltransferase [Phycisphaerae bacterium]
MASLEKCDPEVAAILAAEVKRQSETLELIASENHCSGAVMEAMGSVLTDKYAEGYPNRRYYCGNENADRVEQLCIDRAKALFNAEHANVQPHSGTSANLAVYMACLKPGDKIMGMSLAHGGHLSHGMRLNISGMVYQAASYGVDEKTEQLDMDQVRQAVLKEKPTLLVVGASAYPRKIDFAAFGAIAQEAGCLMMSDIAHIAGLVVGKVHPDPVPHSDFVTTTNHKTLRGPRGGIILCREKWAKAVDAAVFPGIQGGPLEHVIAGKAVAFYEAMQPPFRHYAQRILDNAQTLARELMAKGWRLVSGGTDNHLMLLDLRSRQPDLTGHLAADWLASTGIIANWNSIPFDPRPPMRASGLRFGSPAVTTRGMGADEMKLIAGWIDKILLSQGESKPIDEVRGAVLELCRSFPIPARDGECAFDCQIRE